MDHRQHDVLDHRYFIDDNYGSIGKQGFLLEELLRTQSRMRRCLKSLKWILMQENRVIKTMKLQGYMKKTLTRPCSTAIPKREWMVEPLTFIAAIPDGAATSILGEACSVASSGEPNLKRITARSASIRCDFPVPASKKNDQLVFENTHRLH